MEHHSLESSSENSSCSAFSSESNQSYRDDIQPLKPACRFLDDSVAHFHDSKACESLSTDHTNDKDVLLACQTSTGLDDLMKYSYVPLPKVLSFDLSSTDFNESAEADGTEDPNAERHIFESIFSSLLELIMSAVLMEVSAVNEEAADSDKAEECQTPTSLPFLTGFAETCPPAPKRSTLLLKRFDLSLCRKLDFDSCLN